TARKSNCRQLVCIRWRRPTSMDTCTRHVCKRYGHTSSHSSRRRRRTVSSEFRCCESSLPSMGATGLQVYELHERPGELDLIATWILKRRVGAVAVDDSVGACLSVAMSVRSADNASASWIARAHFDPKMELEAPATDAVKGA